MDSDRTMAYVAIAGLVAVSLFALPQSPLAVTDDGGDDEATGEVKDASLNLAASQLGSSSKISTTAYATLQDGTVVTQSLSSSQFTSWTGTFTNQMSNIDVMAFDSSNYPIMSTVNFDGQTTVNKEIKTAKIAAAGDLTQNFRDDGSTTSSVTLSSGQQDTIDKLRVSVDTQDVYYNAGMVYVDTPDDSNVSIKMPNANAVAVPDSAPSGVDQAFETFDASEGDDSFTAFAEHDTGEITVEADDNNDPSETVTFYTDDIQAYQDSEDGMIKYGVEDGSDTNLGLAEQSVSLTVN